jgi:hypothetical protein
MSDREGKAVDVVGGLSSSEEKGWLALADYAKAVVALASALLGISVTFSQSLVPEHGSEVQRWSLIIAWLALLGAVLFGMLSLASSVNVILRNRRKNRTVLFANLSFLALFLATLAFAILGVSKVLL